MEFIWWFVVPSVVVASLYWWRRQASRHTEVHEHALALNRSLQDGVVLGAAVPVPLENVTELAGLVLQGSSGSLVEFSPSPPRGDGSVSRLPPEVVRVLSPLVKSLPALASNAQHILSDSYRVVLKPEFVEGLRDGTYRMMNSKEVAKGFRLNVIDKTGKIVGQGTNVPVGKALQIASAGFQVATFVTAQAHLAQINARLEEIQATLADVLAHLQEGQEGELRGKMDYLRGLAIDLQARTLSSEEVGVYHGQLETVERETLELARALELELKRCAEQLDEVCLTDWFKTSKTDAAAVKAALGKFERAAKRYELTLWVRLVALQLKAALPHPPATVAARRRDLMESVDKFEDLNHRVLARVRERAGEVRGAMTPPKKLEERRRLIKEEADPKANPILDSIELLREGAEVPDLIENSRSRVESEGLVIEVHRSESGDLVAYAPRNVE